MRKWMPLDMSMCNASHPVLRYKCGYNEGHEGDHTEAICHNSWPNKQFNYGPLKEYRSRETVRGWEFSGSEPEMFEFVTWLNTIDNCIAKWSWNSEYDSYQIVFNYNGTHYCMFEGDVLTATFDDPVPGFNLYKIDRFNRDWENISTD